MTQSESIPGIEVVRPSNDLVTETSVNLTTLELQNLEPSRAQEYSIDGQKNLVGVIRQSDLQREPYAQWFNREYQHYQTDKQLVKQLRSKLTDSSITIVMATWCGDTKRDVPRLLKILDEAGLPASQRKIIAVKRDKIMPDGGSVPWVPTFIVTKNGAEQGRIGQRPRTGQGLEKDLFAIVR